MISDRQAKERERRKDQILKGALSVFKEKGLEKATMDEIAKQADFGKATLYYYFHSKEEIFIELLDRGWKMIWESIEPAIEDHSIYCPTDDARCIDGREARVEELPKQNVWCFSGIIRRRNGQG